ncbi:glycosyltransferase family 2 protein [Aquicoccus porphyridii]|uniref:glycosyltransferase family 2 protein n=1 Tax=Aquicoccus porphyridii TaxID=1852029 RepID=UPI00273E28D1|nr:glycosyltransferase [Aquicoccus porphyridii]
MPGLSVIIPACNEARQIGPCLRALLASSPRPGAGSGSIPLPIPVEVIVVANGCTDDTAQVARGFAGEFRVIGWNFKVLEREKGGKPGALNAGDAAARFDARAYLDADVVVSPPLLDQVTRALRVERAAYVSGKVRITAEGSMVSALYAQCYAHVPFMAQGVPGCGFFAVNAVGRRRWTRFPNIISDDTFVRLLFAPEERIGVAAPYDWPVVRGWRNLVKVRARQDAGVREVLEQFPKLARNAGGTRPGILGKLGLFLRNPPAFAVYAGVALAARMRKADGWSRGR